MIWFSGDHHLGENRFHLLKRPFNSRDEMVGKLIHYHNHLVSDDDTTYFLGDVCWNKSLDYLKYVGSCTGKKILLRGNHDRELTDSELLKYFDKVYPEGETVRIEVNGVEYALNHYPSLGVPDAFNLVGHIHSAWRVQLNMMNVGVDANNFRPVSAEEVEFYRKAIFDVYDEDVWVAYQDFNASFKEERGKPGSYFER